MKTITTMPDPAAIPRAMKRPHVLFKNLAAIYVDGQPIDGRFVAYDLDQGFAMTFKGFIKRRVGEHIRMCLPPDAFTVHTGEIVVEFVLKDEKHAARVALDRSGYNIAGEAA